MKQFLTTEFAIPVKPLAKLNSRFFFMGSCFTEYSALKLSELQFDTTWNPFGILFNPLSMAHAMDRIAEAYEYTEADLYFAGGKFHSLDHHGSFSSPSVQTVLQMINNRIAKSRRSIEKADVIWFTPGTAFVYYHIPKSQFVANCHKIPQSEFEKMLLSENEIIEQLRKMVLKVRKINPDAKIGFTLSPVKHLRDGVAENALSKARLLSALHAFIGQSGQEFDYFPAYEIVTEELRDYRFYAEDLAHPSAWTQSYIFERFLHSRFEEKAALFAEKYARYLRMENHRPLTSDNTELSNWMQKKRSYLLEVREEFPDKVFPNPE